MIGAEGAGRIFWNSTRVESHGNDGSWCYLDAAAGRAGTRVQCQEDQAGTV